jgi:hypothetical protein
MIVLVIAHEHRVVVKRASGLNLGKTCSFLSVTEPFPITLYARLFHKGKRDKGLTAAHYITLQAKTDRLNFYQVT